MGLVKSKEYIESSFTRRVPYANVIFDLNYKESLKSFYLSLKNMAWLEKRMIYLQLRIGKKMNESQKLGDVILW